MNNVPFWQRPVWLVSVLAVGWSSAVWSAPSVPDGYRIIATEYGIPHTILYAIALTESGVRENKAGERRPWPWTLNVGGRGYVYPSRAAAWHALKRFVASGEQSVDIGLMQVNWRYHADKLGDFWRALDPYFNLRIAASILRHCFEQRGDWWAGVGCYHAPANQKRARQYRTRVVNHWQRLAPSE